MTFLLWLLFTALAVGIPPGFIARQLTKGRGQGVEIPGKAVTWGIGSFLLVYLAVTVPWLVISWTGLIDAPWLITGLDRKSTRLNSSHLGISYAVFCLKKKNINI